MDSVAKGIYAVLYTGRSYSSCSPEGKPLFVLSGADDGRAYILEADSQDPEDWSYTLSEPFLDGGEEGNIIGNPTVADLDGDGYTEVVMSLWTQGAVAVFSFSPES